QAHLSAFITNPHSSDPAPPQPMMGGIRAAVYLSVQAAAVRTQPLRSVSRHRNPLTLPLPVGERIGNAWRIVSMVHPLTLRTRRAWVRHMVKVIAIGASQGGVGPLQTIVKGLPRDFQPAVLIALHIGASRSILPSLLSDLGGLVAHHAIAGELIEPGQIY